MYEAEGERRVGMDGHQATLNNTSGSGSAGASTATGGTSPSSVTSLSVLALSSDAGILQVGFLVLFMCGIDVKRIGVENWRFESVHVCGS